MAGDVPVWPDNMALMTVKGGCLHKQAKKIDEYLKILIDDSIGEGEVKC